MLRPVVYEQNATHILLPLFVLSFPSTSVGVRSGSTSNEIWKRRRKEYCVGTCCGSRIWIFVIVRATLVENGLDGLMRRLMRREARIIQNINNRIVLVDHIESGRV